MGQLFAVGVLAANTGDGINTAYSLTWRSNIMRRIDAHPTINSELHEISTANLMMQSVTGAVQINYCAVNATFTVLR